MWVIDLSRVPAGLDAVLDPAERGRAESLSSAGLRRRFVGRRAARRYILADYLGLAPGLIQFTPGLNGKPHPESSGSPQINCSHRDEVGVVAVCAGAPVGVDVEAVRSGAGPEPGELDALAGVMLSSAELAEFRALPAARRRTALLTTWTRKEAVVKAIGAGLSLALDSFDVAVDPATPPRLHARRGAARDGNQWSMADLSLPPGYVGTVMARGSRCLVHTRTWAPQR